MRGFKELDPIAAAVFFAAAAGIAMFTMEPVFLTISFIGSVTLFLILDKKRSVKEHLFFLLLFLVLALINPIVYHNGKTVLFVVNDSPITKEALIYGVFSSMMIVSVLYWFRSFSLIMTTDKLLYIFAGLSPRLSLILSMSLRYIPLMKQQARAINDAQKALGLYKGDNIADLIKGKLRVFSILTQWALENGIITADSMEARGYGRCKRSHFSIFGFKKRDVFFCIFFLFSAAAVMILFIFKVYGFEYYPEISASELSPAAASGYFIYFLLVMSPSALEVKEAVRWKYLTSRI